MIISFDTETFLISNTDVAPPLVCVSFCTDTGASGLFKYDGDGLPAEIRALPGDPVENVLGAWLDGQIVVNHEIFFDFAVICRKYPRLLSKVFRAIDEGRVHCTLLREKLRNNAFGEFRWRKRKDGSNARVNYYLSDVLAHRTGVWLDKGEDTWRLRYSELYDVPLALWPAEADAYPRKDAAGPLIVYFKQEAERNDVLRSGGGASVLRYGAADRAAPLDIFADENRQTRAAWAMQLMSVHGMPLDANRVDALEHAIATERKVLEDWLIEEGLVRVEYYSPNARAGNAGKLKAITRDTKAAQAYMVRVCTELGLEVPMTAGGKKPRKDGSLSPPSVCLDAESIEDTGDEVLQAYADFTSLGNVLGKDVKAMRGLEKGVKVGTDAARGRYLPAIHARFDPLVASGRTACRGFNLQNLRVDGETRHCFVAPPGYVFCLIDLTAAELYAVAQLCVELFGFSKLGDVLRSNPPTDPHCLLVSNMPGNTLTYDQIKAGDAAKDAICVRKRKVGKHSNYGYWGGMRARRLMALVRNLTSHVHALYGPQSETIREGCHPRKCAPKCGKIILTEKEAQDGREGFLRTWPEAQRYLYMFEQMCRRGTRGTVMQYRSRRIRGDLGYSDAANTGFQGLIADLIKEALWFVQREMWDPECPNVPENARDPRTGIPYLYGAGGVRNLPHDELISVVPEAIGHECAHRIRDIVLETGRRWLPDVPPTGEVYLARYWSKSAFALQDKATKRLLPWNGEKK